MSLLGDFQDSFGGPRVARFPDWAKDHLVSDLDTAGFSIIGLDFSGISFSVQPKNYVFCGPLTGPSAAPGFRLLQASEVGAQVASDNLDLWSDIEASAIGANLATLSLPDASSCLFASPLGTVTYKTPVEILQSIGTSGIITGNLTLGAGSTYTLYGLDIQHDGPPGYDVWFTSNVNHIYFGGQWKVPQMSAPPSPTLGYFARQNNQPCDVVLDTWSGSNNIYIRKANGAHDAQTKALSGDRLGRFGFSGAATASRNYGPSALIQATATEDYTTVPRGADWVMQTIRTGQTALETRLSLLGDGTGMFNGLFLSAATAASSDGVVTNIPVPSDVYKLGHVKVGGYTGGEFNLRTTQTTDVQVPAIGLIDSDPVSLYKAMGSVIQAQTVAISRVSSSVILASGSARFHAMYVASRFTIQGVKWYQVTAGNYTGDTSNIIALYSYSAGVLTRRAVSADDSALWKVGTGGFGAKLFQATYTAPAGVYFIAFLYHSSAETTAPVLGAAVTMQSQNMATIDLTNTSYLNASLATQTTLGTSVTMSTLTGTNTQPWLALY